MQQLLSSLSSPPPPPTGSTVHPVSIRVSSGLLQALFREKEWRGGRVFRPEAPPAGHSVSLCPPSEELRLICQLCPPLGTGGLAAAPGWMTVMCWPLSLPLSSLEALLGPECSSWMLTGTFRHKHVTPCLTATLLDSVRAQYQLLFAVFLGQDT